ncbi:hypothetical protein ACI78Q_00275 [Geodermatophilus sp. SYSU D00705]
MDDHEDDVDAAAQPVAARPPRRNHLQELRNRAERVRVTPLEDDEGDGDYRQYSSARHVDVHEAGHAVAALDNGIEFKHIIFFDEGAAPSFEGGLFEGSAGLEFGDTRWTADPVASFRVAFAGLYAEMAVLHEANADNSEVDKDNWHRGVGLTGSVSDEERDTALGQRADDLLREIDDWARRNADRITRLADHLTARRRAVPPGQPLVVPYAEVRAVLTDQS